jgi:platelet-activating factor acetylhydrolase IB subunit alpha
VDIEDLLQLLPYIQFIGNINNITIRYSSIANLSYLNATVYRSLIASGSEDTTIKLWDFETAQYERTLKGHTGPITAVTFSPSGTLIVSASTDMTAKIWDSTSSYQCTKTLRAHDHTLSSVAFLPSGDFILTCSRDQSIRLWEVSTGFSVRTFNGHSDWVRCLAVSSDGSMFSSGSSDQTVAVWRIDSPSPLHVLRGHEHVVETVAYGLQPVDWVALATEATSSGDGSVSEKQSSMVCG